MKKFLALILAVALLTVAGAAMAAEPTLTVDKTSLTVKAGTTATVTVTAAAANSGTLGNVKVSGVSWASLSGNTLTLSPSSTVTEGTYNIAVSVTETYAASGVAGHGSVSRTASAKKVIAVSVLPASTSAGTVVVTKIVETVVTVTKTVTIIASAARDAAVVETFEQVTRTVSEVITTTVLQEVRGFAQALIAVWTAPAKVAAVEQKKNEVTATLSSSTGRENVFKYSKVPAGASTEAFTPKSNTLLQPAASSVASDATPEQKLAAATSALSGNNKKALSAGEAVKPTESGTFTFSKTFGKALYGTKIGGSRNKQKRTAVVSSFSAAAAEDDEEGVAFVDSAGNIVNVIPGEEKSQDIMPGFVNMLVVMEANEVYEPVVFATVEDLESNDVAIDTASVDVEVADEVVVTTEDVVVDVKEDGSVGDETVVEKADTTVESSIASAMSANSAAMVPAANYGAEIETTILATEDAIAASSDLHVAARIGRSFKELGNGTYYYKVSFDALPSGRTLESGAVFEFYPDGIAAGTTAYVKVFDEYGTEITTAPASIFGKTGIVAFQIENSGIVETANFDNTLENPTVTIKMNPAGSGEVTDAVLSALEAVGYVNATSKTILDAGFAQKVTFSSSVNSGTVRLNFDVDPSSWRVAVAGNGSIAASAIGTISNATANQATITLNKSEITAGNHAVTLYVRPMVGIDAARSDVSASLGSIEGNPGLPGVGSSSGGCSAGSAVLALAVLGAFIATRKK